MNTALGEVIPLGVAVAISPLPIIAAILLVLSPNARGNSLAFLLGWVLGILAPALAFVLLSSALPAHEENVPPRPVEGAVEIVLGVYLLYLAWRQWKLRPRDGVAPTLPKWMATIDTITIAGAVGLGIAAVVVNPKNLVMSAKAGTEVGLEALPFWENVLVLTLFVLLAASTVLIPVIGYLVAADKLHAPLQRMRTWLLHENAAIMAVVMLMMGTSFISTGIQTL